ncbi:MAG: type II toxin-antitoxin system HipA family toxin [Rhodocyclaceae bacterium]|nr:type II toxin-antitoxin system HipA family toxin [Rhodocyclaceae bacterium]
MKKLQVRYRGWGEDWPLGALADDGTELLFEYSPEALAQGLELSPRHLRLRPQAYGGFPDFQHRLPGLIADALPDGWGLLLMDRVFRQRGVLPTPLDRLAFIGERALGALGFVPADAEPLPLGDLQLLALAQESQRVQAGKDTNALLALVLTGGSPQGARPKALVHYDPSSRHVSTLPGASASGSAWLVKFQAQGEHKEVCAIENLYAQLARACGLSMPDTQYFDLNSKLAGFGVARFDIEDGMRVPVHTLAGLLHADIRVPSTDYTTFLRATRLLTRDEREVQKAFAHAVFNVIFHNRDDHARNFSYRLGRDRRWRLSPCYDLTFSNGPSGEHQTDVCGAGRNVTRPLLLSLASQGGIDAAAAKTTIDRIADQAGRFRELAHGHPIRQATVSHIARVIEDHRMAVGRT